MGPFTLAAKQNKKTQRILLRVIISTELAKNRDKTLIFSVGNLDRCPPMPDEARVPLILRIVLNAHRLTPGTENKRHTANGILRTFGRGVMYR